MQQRRLVWVSVLLACFLSLQLFPSGVAAKDIYADVACIGTGVGTSVNPYCSLSQAFLDASISIGDVTVHITGGWLTTPLQAITSPAFTSLSVVPWIGAQPSISCIQGPFQPALLQISNTNATVTFRGITIAGCNPSMQFTDVKTVILDSMLLVDGQGIQVTQSFVNASYNSSLQIYDSQFIANTSPVGSKGGGLYTSGMTSVFINNTNFLKNTGWYAGGGAAISTFFAQISYSDFLENGIDGSAVGTFSGGAGLAITNLVDSNSNVTPAFSLQYTNFISNNAGVGFYVNNGGGLFILDTSSSLNLDIERCSFKSNEATSGAGVLIDTTQVTSTQRVNINLVYSAFQSNLATNLGAGVMLSGPTAAPNSISATVQTLLLTNNVAGQGGGAIYVSNAYLELNAVVSTANLVTTLVQGPDSGIVRLLNLATGSSLDNLYISYSGFSLIGYNGLMINGPSTTTIYLSDTYINNNAGNGILVSDVNLIIARTAIYDNWGGAIIAAGTAYVLANNSLSIAYDDLILFTVFPVSCLGTNSQIILNNGTAVCNGILNNCWFVDVCGNCKGVGPDCLCKGTTVPSLINCNSPITLQLPGTMTATFSPTNGRADAFLFPLSGVAGVTVQYVSVKNVATGQVFQLDNFKPQRPVRSVTIDVNDVFLSSFSMNINNYTTVILSQNLYDHSSVTASGSSFLLVPQNTLKMSFQYASTNKTVLTTTQLNMAIVTTEPILNVQYNSSQTLLTATATSYGNIITTPSSQIQFALIDSAQFILGNGSYITMPIEFYATQTSNDTILVVVTFPVSMMDTFVAVTYDPDFSVVVNPESSSSGDGGDGNQTLLIEILVPALVGGALVIVVGVIIIAMIVFGTKAILASQARKKGVGTVNFD